MSIFGMDHKISLAAVFWNNLRGEIYLVRPDYYIVALQSNLCPPDYLVGLQDISLFYSLILPLESNI